MRTRVLSGPGPFRWGRCLGVFLVLALSLIGSQAAFAAVTVNPASLPAGTLAVPYDETVVGNGGAGPYIFAVIAGALPPGITLDGSSGQLSGTPTVQGVYSFTLRATDSLSATGQRAYTVSVGTFSLAVQPNTLPNGVQGVAYNQALTAVGGNPPYTFTRSSGTLPTGVLLASDGTMSGTPSAGGSFTFIVQAQDPDGNSGFRTYNIVVGANSISISPPTLPNGTQGVGYSQSVTASGGDGGPYTYSVSSGALPSGLSLNTGSGLISGTPTAGGSFSFTIRAVDASTNFGTRNYTVTVGGNSLSLNPASLPNGTQGNPYSQNVTASGGTGGPYTYSITSGSLPTGLSLNTSSGAITGTPSAGGAFSFTVHAVDGNNNFGNRNYTVNIGTNSLTVTPGALPGGTQGVGYSQTVGATGGTAPYTFAVSAGALPNGLSLNGASGAITGTPTAAGSFNFTIRATDVNANTGSQAYNVNIAPVPLTVNPSALPNGTQGVAYSQTVTTAGGVAPYTYAVMSGALPTGLSLNGGSGAITGTPTAAGNFNFTIQSTDSTPNTGTRSYSVTIGTNSLTVSPSGLPNGSQGVAYSQTVSASGGTGPYTFAVTSGALPSGLTLNAGSGAISGTPTGSGVSNFTIQATDTVGNIGNRGYALNIGTSTLTVNPTSLPNGSSGVAYGQTVIASGGTGPYTFAVSSGALPAGLVLNAASGAISGTPTGSGLSNFTIRALDSVGDIGSRAYAVNIGTSTLSVNPAGLPNGSAGIAYSQTVTASGGTGPYSFAVTSGALPTGLVLNAGSGAISGTPTGGGLSNFTIQATDSVGNIGSRVYALNIGTSTLSVNPASLPNGSTGIAYSQTVTASGGTGPYSFAVTSGSLPTGLVLNAGSGAISGTPTGSGVSNFTIQATDSFGNIGSRGYAVNIGTSTLTVNPGSLPNGSVGVSYGQTVTASGGSGPFSFAVTAGALPGGLSLNGTTGAITGTPAGGGSFAFTIRAIDTNGNTGSRSYTVNVGTSTLTISAPTLPNASQGSPYSQTVTASGGTGPYVLALILGALPSGLSFNPSSGAITGTPTGSGPSTFTIRATDVNGNIGTRSYTVNVGGNSLTINPATLPAAPKGRAYSQALGAVGGAASYTFALQSGSLPPGLSVNAAGQITGTPASEGSFTFTMRVTDGSGSFGTRTYTLATLRGDPANDPEVRGLVAAQAASARRFTDAQTSNVLRRLESLHDNFNPCGLNFGINASTYAPPPAYPLDPATGSAFPPVNKDPLPPPRPATPLSKCDSMMGPPIAVWASGALEFGKMTNTGLLVDSTKFSTAGVTAGIDARVADELIVGGAVGFGRDRTDIGLKGTISDANNLNGVVYASYKPMASLFIDAVVGYGSLNFDNKRWVPLDGTTVSGKRDGGTWFGSFSVSSEFRRGIFRFSPYARIDAMTAKLGEYSETGDALSALTFKATSVSSTAGVLGLRGSVDFSDGANTYTPSMRIEYKRAFDRGFTQSMFYGDTAGSNLFAINTDATTRDVFTGAIGIRANIGPAATLELEYGVSGTPAQNVSWVSQMVRAAAHWNFEAN
jgi:uncharacterized protein YhjY with autotransporter beta-barrel domain